MKPLFALLLPFLLFMAKVYYDRAVGFSFGDEWHNFTTAFFMLKGRDLYSEIFNNHQMLMTYISFGLQNVVAPENLYQLVVTHRLFIILFSLIMNVLLLYRFRGKVVVFVVFYELTKYYFFGHLFLPEAVVVYPLVFLFGLALEKLQKKTVSTMDLVIGSIFAWFVIFTREPYIPIALILFILLLWRNWGRKLLLPISIFSTLSLLALLSIAKSLPDYFSSIITFNVQVAIPAETGSTDPFTKFAIAFFYPIYIPISGKATFLRNILIGLDLVFLLTLFVAFAKQKLLKKVFLFIWLLLGLAGLRYVAPGTLFYESFHMLVWYGLFLAALSFLVVDIYRQKTARQIGTVLILFLVAVLLYTVSPSSFIWEKIDKEKDFTTHYVHYFLNGEVIGVLSKSSDTLFTDMWDYFIHMQAGLDSSYKYAIYSFASYGYPKFDIARMEMFQESPPDFYYTLCAKDATASALLPDFVASSYIQLHRQGKPTCTYVKKSKLPSITKEQWEEAKKLGFSIIE